MEEMNLEDQPLPDELPVGETSESDEAENTEDDAKPEPDKGAKDDADDASADAEDADDDADDSEEEPADTKETKSQRKRRLRREREQERERENKRLKDEIARLRQDIETEKAPEYDTYRNPDDYTADRAAWAARQQLTQAELKRAEEAAKRAEEGVTSERREAVNDVLEEGQSKHADYRDVVSNPNLALSHEMLSAALEADNSADVLYYLGKNPDAARQMAGLNPVAQAVEVGRLSTRLSAPKKKTSSAPAPIKPVKGNSAKLDKSPSDMTYDEYKAWRMGKQP